MTTDSCFRSTKVDTVNVYNANFDSLR